MRRSQHPVCDKYRNCGGHYTRARTRRPRLARDRESAFGIQQTQAREYAGMNYQGKTSPYAAEAAENARGVYTPLEPRRRTGIRIPLSRRQYQEYAIVKLKVRVEPCKAICHAPRQVCCLCNNIPVGFLSLGLFSALLRCKPLARREVLRRVCASPCEK